MFVIGSSFFVCESFCGHTGNGAKEAEGHLGAEEDDGVEAEAFGAGWRFVVAEGGDLGVDALEGALPADLASVGHYKLVFASCDCF